MRAASAMSAASGAGADDASALSAPPEASPSLGLAASTLQQVGHLVRQAMVFLENDHKAAMRCLNDASALLASGSHDLPPAVPLTHRAFLPGGLARWQAKRALAYIEANLGSKLSPRQLADLVAFSKSHFSRAFKRSLGLAPMAYVVSRRVERAKAMMRSTREPLSEIALACGFADQSHLTRSFHRCVGMSPGLWRRIGAESGNPNPRPRELFRAAPRVPYQRTMDGSVELAQCRMGGNGSEIRNAIR
jgi:AraC family transcriptional regulator